MPTGTLKEDLIGSIDSFKGLLMLVVVLDHNDVAHLLLPKTFHPLTFHVLGFLLLPFIVGRSAWSRSFALDRIARYGVPQFWILTVSALLFWLVNNRSETFIQFGRDYLMAFFIGSAPLVKRSSGFLAYWFLPTLLGLVITLAAYRAMSSQWRLLTTGCFVVGHLILVDTFFPAYQWIPFGLAIVINIFVLGLLFQRLVESRTVYKSRWLFPVLFVVSYGWMTYTNSWLEIAVLHMVPITHPVTLIVQDVAALSGVVTILLIGDFMRENKFIASIGRLSLMIYLAHPLGYAAFDAIAGAIGWHPPSIATLVTYGVVSYGAALAVAWGIAGFISASSTLSNWITPKTFHDSPLFAAFVSSTPVDAARGRRV